MLELCEYNCHPTLHRPCRARVEPVVVQLLPVPCSVFDSVIVVQIHLLYNKGAKVIGGKLFFARVLYLGLVVHLVP